MPALATVMAPPHRTRGDRARYAGQKPWAPFAGGETVCENSGQVFRCNANAVV